MKSTFDFSKQESLPIEVKECLNWLEKKKALDSLVIDVKGKSSITADLVITSANSEPHLKALYETVRLSFKQMGIVTISSEFNLGSGWAVIDVFNIMVHLFIEKVRDYYKIEQLWG